MGGGGWGAGRSPPFRAQARAWSNQWKLKFGKACCRLTLQGSKKSKGGTALPAAHQGQQPHKVLQVAACSLAL